MTDIQVTDHALVRWLERVKGVDVAALKSELLTDDLVAAARLGAKKYKSGDLIYALNGGKVITVMNKSEEKRRPFPNRRKKNPKVTRRGLNRR